MSCLDATFTLTPQSPVWVSGSGTDSAYLWCHGSDFWSNNPFGLSYLYSTNQFFFDGAYASDPGLDFRQWPNRRAARFLETWFSFDPAAAGKQLILIFAFDTFYSDGRVQVYSDATLLSDQVLHSGDNQFAIVIDSPEQPLTLYYIHAGGYWLFKGISGYLV